MMSWSSNKYSDYKVSISAKRDGDGDWTCRITPPGDAEHYRNIYVFGFFGLLPDRMIARRAIRKHRRRFPDMIPGRGVKGIREVEF